MTNDDRLREPPRDRLAGASQVLDLADMAAALRAEPHAATTGHRQIAVARRGPLSVLLFVFDRDGHIPEHRTPGDVLIQVVSGELEVTLSDDVITLVSGQLLTLAPHQPHAVRALEPTDMLLTIIRLATPTT